MAKPRYNSRQLSQHLREIAAEALSVDNDGELVTNGEKLARILWERALGFEEVRRNDKGEEIKVQHTPEAWAIQLVYDRLEGKIPQAIADDTGKVTAAQKVSDLSKARINAMAGAAAGPRPPSLPRPLKPLPPKQPRKEPPNGTDA